jgi:hypothetical protein
MTVCVSIRGNDREKTLPARLRQRPRRAALRQLSHAAVPKQPRPILLRHAHAHTHDTLTCLHKEHTVYGTRACAVLG